MAIKLEDVAITGDLTVQGTFNPPSGSFTNAHINSSAAIVRTKLETNLLQAFPVPLTDLRVFDALHTNLPGTAASDDLALIGGAFGTNTPMIKTSDAKATTTTQRARFLVRLPAEYTAAGSVKIRLHAGMGTTVSDTTATVDVEAYESNKEGGLGSDLVTTSATTINSLTLADKDFTLTAAGLAPGDWLDVRVTIAITDGATATAVLGVIGHIALLCDIIG